MRLFLAAGLIKFDEMPGFLEEDYRERSSGIILLRVQQVFDFLHSDERYRTLVKKIGLPPAY